MYKKFTFVALILVFVLTLVIAPTVMAGGEYSDNPAIYTTWESGEATAECDSLLYPGAYQYAWKYNELGGEGVPNGSETATFDGHSNTITLSNSNGYTFAWSATNSIGAMIIKADIGANVWFYNPQVKSDTDLYGYQNKEISHVTFCWNPDQPPAEAQWCSPGYWRQLKHQASWVPTGYETNTKFFAAFGYYPVLSKLGKKAGATTNPTLWQVLRKPQYYGGGAFNAVGDLLSAAHPDVNFTGERVKNSCPLK